MGKCDFDSCKRKLPLSAYACRCKLLYCAMHVPPEEHKCTYNFHEEHKKTIERNLSSMTITKKEIYAID